MEKSGLTSLDSIKALQDHYKQLQQIHLKELLQDKSRNEKLQIKNDHFVFNFSHEKLNQETLILLKQLSKEQKLKAKFENMFKGEKINLTEGRRVLHTALRKEKNASLILDDNVDVVKEVHQVLERVKNYSDDIRKGVKLGYTGKKLKNFVSIGIGGSYLGPEFIYNAIRNNYPNTENYQIRFLANVCPIDFFRAVENLNIEETLFIVISKTFTTAETMLNARNCKEYLIEEFSKKLQGNSNNEDNLNNDVIEKIIAAHFCAVSTNLPETDKFGINPANVFGFWDWVGGRYSSWSAVGAVPLSLFFGYDIFEQFLAGGRFIDKEIETFFNNKDNEDLPVAILLGLIGFYNTFICNKTTRAILPYSQALNKFASHVQQLDMESNGKKVSISTNEFLSYEAGPIVFGEPGTNGQHSFYQLIHQGREIACEFIGHAKAQQDIKYKNEQVSNHEELMCNFFAQPDALALGKSKEDLIKNKTSENLINHKTFLGDRNSSSLLFKELNAFSTGLLLAIYEHRVATEGFLYDVNSFDQWGVELGKVLANDVKKVFLSENKDFSGFNSATIDLINYFIQNK